MNVNTRPACSCLRCAGPNCPCGCNAVPAAHDAPAETTACACGARCACATAQQACPCAAQRS